MRTGDMLLLCSDGLTTMVPDDEIARVLGEAGGDVEQAPPRRSWTRPTRAAARTTSRSCSCKFEE